MDGYRSVLRPHWESKHDFVVCPARGAVTVQFVRLRYLLWASQVQTLRTAEWRRCQTGTALTIAVGRQLATTRTMCDYHSARFKLHIYVTHKFHSWGSEPMQHVFVSCIHFISTVLSNEEKKLVYFPYALPSLWEWAHVVLYDHGVVECCSQSML